MDSMNYRNQWSILLLALAASTSGCVYGYAEYDGTPSYASESERSGPPVLRYAIPSDAPKGEAYVMSLGVQSFTAADGTPSPMLLLRIAVENKSAEPWILDPADAALAFDDMAPVPPTYAKGSKTAGPQTIAPGGRGELNLYFTLPAGARPQAASLSWQVRRGSESTALNSRFDLMTGSDSDQLYYAPVYDPALVYAWGPGWWWGPSWYWGWGLGWGWGGPWWYGGWRGWRGYPHYHHGGGGYRGRPMYRGGGGGGFHGQPMYRGGGFHGGGGFRGGGGGGAPIRGGGAFRGGGRR
jgi:hypothetical protein